METKKRVVFVNSGHYKTCTEGEGDRDRDRGDKTKVVADDKSEESDKKKNMRMMMIANYEVKVGDGDWPKWLVDNIPQNVLSTLIRKTADSYEKLGKVSNNHNLIISVYTLFIVYN